VVASLVPSLLPTLSESLVPVAWDLFVDEVVAVPLLVP
jgi:hypothetical protein